MRRTGLPIALIVILTAGIAGCSKRDATPGAVGTGGAGANLNDSEFVRDVAMKNLAETELSRMALDKSPSADVKTFAQMMIDDHAAAGSNLRNAVAGQSIEWPAQLDDKHREAAGELSKKQGADFDRDYMKAMVEGHQDFTAKLESRLDMQSVADWKTQPAETKGNATVRPAAGGDSRAMKINQWAADTYPVAQKHLETARALENTTKKRSTN